MSKSVSIKLPCWLLFMIVAIMSAPTLGKISSAGFSVEGASGEEDFGVFMVPDADSFWGNAIGCEQTGLFMGTVKSEGDSSSIGVMGTRGVRLSS